MTPLIFFAVVVIGPAAALTLLRVNAAVVFLSLCLGSVLVQFMGSDATSFITAFSPHASSFSESTIPIGLLVLPAALTTIFMFHSVRGMRLIANLLPALTVGLLGLLLVEPLLSPGLQGTITHSSLWHQYTSIQSMIVGLSAIISLVFLWFQRRRPAPELASKRRSRAEPRAL